MICPRCLLNLTREQTSCPRCHLSLSGFSKSLLVAMKRNVDASEEPRHVKLLLAGIGALTIGLVTVLICRGVGREVLGPLYMLCGMTTLIVSRCGKKWKRLTTTQKALVAPGVMITFVVFFWLLATRVILTFLMGFR